MRNKSSQGTATTQLPRVTSIDTLRLGDAYGHLAANLPSAIARSALCGVLILLVSTRLNRVGFRLKL
jgi:hypothetical protein